VISRPRLLAAVAATSCLIFGAFSPSASGAAAAWLPVATTGPTVLPPEQSETQNLWVDAETGTYTLGFTSSGSGEGEFTEGSTTVTNVTAASGVLRAGQEIVAFGIPGGTTIAAFGAGTMTLSVPPTVTAQLQFSVETAAVTPPIAVDADASALEGALDALLSIGGLGGSVRVFGGPAGAGASNPYSITFGGSLADTDVARIEPNSSALSGGRESAAIATAVPGGRGTSTLALYLQNVGGESDGTTPTTYNATLPPGVTLAGAPSSDPFAWICSGAAGAPAFTCTSGLLFGEVASTQVAPKIEATITSSPGASGGDVHLVATGGGGDPAESELPLKVSATPSRPGLQTFTAGAYDADGDSDTRAGGHPFSASTAIFVNTRLSAKGDVVPVGELKDISVDLPPGFLGNPVAVPQCPESTADFDCPPDTQVGVAQVVYNNFGTPAVRFPVYDTQAPFGYPAKFRFNVQRQVPLSVVGDLRSDGDYGITAASLNTPTVSALYGTFFTFWGAPADPTHDALRCSNLATGEVCGQASDAPKTAFLTSATNCAEEAAHPPVTALSVNTWQFPEEVFEGDVGIPAVTGCDKLHFESSFTFQPDGIAAADSPAAFTTNLSVPSEGLTNPEKLTTPEAKTTVVRFPKGLVLNPSAADGLGSCSEAQIGLKGTDFAMPNPIRFDTEPNTCPESSKIGTAEIKTALLEEPLHGALYLANQGENPFDSLFAVYLVIEDPRHGIFIKLPGNTKPDPADGQITATFEDLPQLPFESLKLNFKGGSRAPFATPTTCGRFDTTTVNTPWSAPESGPPFETHDEFAVSSGPDGAPCANTPAQRPFNLGFNAGSADATAGAHSSFNLRVTRPDGAQEMSSLQIVTPVGFTASLKGVSYCSDAEIEATERDNGRAEQSKSTCPAASQVGTDLTGVGSGANPYYAPGKVYLAGPYKGAPLSVVAVTPAVAGPFDLGTVVVRAALHVNAETAQITAATDRLPEYLKGVALRIRDIRINLDRPDWALNPTGCEPKTVEVSVAGNSGATAKPSSPFKVGGCGALAFRPKLALSLRGGTRRGTFPRLTATLTQKPGQANIGRVAVTLPHSEFLEQGHIGTVCTRVQFNAVPRACPAKSIYGYAEAESPLLDYKLSGPVYLRSSDHKLPDLVAALQGPAAQPIEIDLDGRIDSKKGGIRSSFEAVPDAPVSKFVLHMRGGKKGLLVNSTNLCAATAKARRATVRIVGQNNKRADQSPVVANQCGRHKKKPRGKRHHDRGHALKAGRPEG
jgi:hypothetical protein